jgi:hypothetical protein
MDFYKFLDIYFVQLGNENTHGIFKDILYNVFHFPQHAV